MKLVNLSVTVNPTYTAEEVANVLKSVGLRDAVVNNDAKTISGKIATNKAKLIGKIEGVASSKYADIQTASPAPAQAAPAPARVAPAAPTAPAPSAESAAPQSGPSISQA